jgi:hypothetical protein
VRILIPTLFTLALAAVTVAGCTADLTEGCLSGKCPPPEMTTATSSTSTGAGGQDGGVPCDPLPATGDIPCDVFKVIHGVCNRCHQDPPLAGAPFPLLSYEDTQMPYDTHGKLRYQRMHEVIQPDGSPHMPFKSTVIVVPELTPEQFATLDAWLACPTPTAQGQGCECPGEGCTPLPPEP